MKTPSIALLTVLVLFTNGCARGQGQAADFCTTVNAYYEAAAVTSPTDAEGQRRQAELAEAAKAGAPVEHKETWAALERSHRKAADGMEPTEADNQAVLQGLATQDPTPYGSCTVPIIQGEASGGVQQNR